jgi:Transposase DDE domain
LALAATKEGLRQKLSGDSLFKDVRSFFSEIPDHRAANHSYPLVDICMSSFSIFSLKSPSLLAHESYATDKSIKNNFATIYGVKQMPSDTQMRSVLDKVETNYLQNSLTKTLKLAEQAGLLDDYRFLDGDLIISIDGTGFFCSNSVKCDCCQVKKRKGGTEYSHSMFAASIVHPGKKQVLPIAPEPITKQDGKSKNDHELRAAARLLQRFKKDHPDLKATIVADGLFSKGPLIKLLQQLDLNYIISAKPKDHKYLFECFEKKELFAGIDEVLGAKRPIIEKITIKKGDVTHIFEFANDMSLNQTHHDLKVGFIKYWEINKKKMQHFSWVTNHRITKQNIFKLMKAARARWKIENETFNTLKNQGYHFEHNYGHGTKNLSNNMAVIMMITFLVDQIQEICCEIFQRIRDLKKSRRVLWESLRSYFSCVPFASWSALLDLVLENTSTA